MTAELAAFRLVGGPKPITKVGPTGQNISRSLPALAASNPTKYPMNCFRLRDADKRLKVTNRCAGGLRASGRNYIDRGCIMLGRRSTGCRGGWPPQVLSNASLFNSSLTRPQPPSVTAHRLTSILIDVLVLHQRYDAIFHY